MILVRPDFSFYIFNIVHACKYYGLKSRGHISGNVTSAELGKEIKNDLIVRSAVHFIDNQDNWFF